VLHQIGIGTLGPVFRTYEPTRDRLVSVKAFRLDIVPEQAQALAAALSRATKASLFHPSIVEPIEAGVEGTVAYRAEEYVAAESLDVAMRHYAPAPIDKVLPFITQLAGAVDFARAAGIGHGGLHPRDIFVTPDEARATGFGVVEALEQVGIRAPIRRPYSAPERIDGRAWGTPADVFSLAAITFELLTGKRPSGTGAQIGALPDGEHASALQAVLARAMDDEPSRRHASALAFAGALEAASQGRRISEVVPVPVPAPPVAPPPAPAAETRVTTIAEAEAAAGLEEVEAAAAGIVEPQTAVEPEPDLDDPAFPEADEDDEPEIAEAAVEATPPITVPAAATGGEFDVEAALMRDGKAGARTLFDDDVDVAGSTTVERADRLRPLDDEPTYASETSIAAEAPMFGAGESDRSLPDPDETSRSPILPSALLLVLGLLVGFAVGYFVGSRDRLPAATGTTAAVTTPRPAAPAPAQGQNRPATAEQPGQYSEQKIATPPPAVETTRAAPPAVTRPAPAPAVATKGQIVVHSVPTRAGVTVNGMWRGRTPITLDNLAFGSYVVRVVEGGYKVARDEFTLSAREPSRTFTARLELAPAAAVRGPAPPAAAAAAPAASSASFTGSLYVDSRPRGARVTIDGKSVGQTPVTVPEVMAGSHVVRIEMDGKKPVTANPRIVAGQTERVTVSLEDREDGQDAPAAAREGRREPARSAGPSAQRVRRDAAESRTGEGRR
jgi:hypothetical protein